jgi:hypothetical protein
MNTPVPYSTSPNFKAAYIAAASASAGPLALLEEEEGGSAYAQSAAEAALHDEHTCTILN